MDLHLKQWRNQENESEEQQPCSKLPKLLPDTSSNTLPLFLSDHTNSKPINMSAFPDSTSRSFPRMGSYFSLGQWQELELQALIYRYMLAGAVVPPELIHPIKTSLLHSSPFFLHHPLQPSPLYQPAALLQSGYWSRGGMDPEPGRCRRTDGKKWRCARDVVVGQKYCERHMHRGKNRSRKPVEIPTSSTNNSSLMAVGTGGDGGIARRPPPAVVASAPTFNLSGGSSSPMDLLHQNQSASESRTGHKFVFEATNEGGANSSSRPQGHTLRHFFDDWPRSVPDHDDAGSNAASTCLSISMPGNTSSDVSLKLSTGNGDEMNARVRGRESPQLNWGSGWTTNQMGGPLAEALRSSISNSSPTSVLHV